MLKQTKDFLEKYNIKNKNVIIAFSAGPDSTALSLVLNELKEKFGLNLTLAYFNHGWREKEALNEENFTKNLAQKLCCNFEIGHAPKNSKQNEETARNLRYEFLSDCAKKFNTDIVMLAHNKNDNIETALYRIIKGTSIKGLSAIPENREIFYRPLLNIEKKEILNFLKEKKQEFLIDSSNNDVKYKRNLIRKEILPLFNEINPNYINAINNLIISANFSKKIIENSLEKIKKEILIEEKNEILKDKFLALEENYQLEILNDFLGEYLKYRDFKTLSRFLKFILNNDNSKISVNSFYFLVVKNNSISLKKIENKKTFEEILIEKEGEYSFQNVLFKIEKIDKKNKENIVFPKSNENFCYLSLEFPLSLRTRKAGDIFSPFGLKGKMKLKDYLINEKIPQEKKDNLILLAKENEICWVLGEKISENYKIPISKENPKEIFKVSYKFNQR